MAAVSTFKPPATVRIDDLRDPARAIGGPAFDAAFFWGAPLLAALLVWIWVDVAAIMPRAGGEAMIAVLIGGIAILTFAHLIAVAPRAYLNRDVFAQNRRRLTLVPVLLLALLLASPTALLIGAVVAVFWDVHHTAMQNFGLSRIYDLKSGQGGTALRRTDLALNWLLYVGPIGAGASLIAHLDEFDRLKTTPLGVLTQVPGLAASGTTAILTAALIAWASVIAFAVYAYVAEHRRGYVMPAHKLALLLSTGATSIIAWTLSPPFIAFAIVNLFHAVQYFALVWVKEGKRIEVALPRGPALPMFLGLCAIFGLTYYVARSLDTLMAPFIACSLLHFWFDSFIWSVRKRQV